MAEQVSISKEEYEKLLHDREAQQKLFDVIEQLQNQVKTVQEQNERMHEQMEAVQHQMEIFSMHFGRMYASQSIEETLSAMAELGSDEIHASECAVYSVDAYNETEMFTVDQTGERIYLSPDESSLLRQSIAQHQPFVINELSQYSNIGDGTKAGDYQNLLIVPLEDKNGDVIGLAVAKDKEGGFTQDDVKAFDLKDGKVGNTFRMGLENKALQQKATTDALTHLPNREGMNQFIKQQALPHIKHGEPVSVMLFDIDKFKKFNDTYGHDVGDDCLKLVADTLSANLRSGEDSGVFRWGGEEMVAIVPVDEAKAVEIAQRLREAVQNAPLEIEDKGSASVTVSCGVAQFDTEQPYGIGKSNVLEAFEYTFEKADSALYFAKENGRNQVAKSSTIEQDLLLNANLSETIVLNGMPENVWVSGTEDFAVVYSGITKKAFPEMVDMLIDRAETQRFGRIGCEIGNEVRMADAEFVNVNFAVDDVLDKGIYAELELTGSWSCFGIIEVPLTNEEQSAVRDALVNFMKEHDMEVPEFISNAGTEKKEPGRTEKAMEEKLNDTKNYAELLKDMFSAMDYTIDKNDKGEYQIFDTQTETYLVNEHYDTDTFRTAEEITDRVYVAIAEKIVDDMHEAIAEYLYNTYKTDSNTPDELEEFSSIVDADEIDKYIKEHPDVCQSLRENGYGSNIEYIDLLVNHLDDVNMEQLFSQKWIDDISIDSDPLDAVIYDAEDGVLDIHLTASDAIVSEMLKISFDWGKQTETVLFHGHVPDFKQAGIDYADLYVEFREADPEKPVYTISLQMTDDSKQYFSTEPDANTKLMIVTDDMKTSANAVISDYFEGKSIKEIIDEKKHEDKDMTD